MNTNDLNTLKDIAKRKIDKGATLQDIQEFITNTQSQDIFLLLENELTEYIQLKEKIKEENKNYWMLVCNPMTWDDEDGFVFHINDTLKNLHMQEEGEWWKINDKTNMERKMKLGHKGIIKLSDDTRSKEHRTNHDGDIMPLLESGIYGIFEITNDHEGDHIYQFDNGYWYVHIDLIDNFFDKGINISKEESIELLTENIYKSQSSREIDKLLFDKVETYINKFSGKD